MDKIVPITISKKQYNLYRLLEILIFCFHGVGYLFIFIASLTDYKVFDSINNILLIVILIYMIYIASMLVLEKPTIGIVLLNSKGINLNYSLESNLKRDLENITGFSNLFPSSFYIDMSFNDYVAIKDFMCSRDFQEFCAYIDNDKELEDNDKSLFKISYINKFIDDNIKITYSFNMENILKSNDFYSAKYQLSNCPIKIEHKFVPNLLTNLFNLDLDVKNSVITDEKTISLFVSKFIDKEDFLSIEQSNKYFKGDFYYGNQ